MFTNKRYSSSQKAKMKFTRKRVLLLVIAGLSAVMGLLFVLERKGVIELPYSSSDQQPSSNTNNGINYDPPTTTEKKETEQHKKELGDESTSPTPPVSSTTGKKMVTPVMTSWVATPEVEVRGYVAGVNEEGGTCTLTLTKGAEKISQSKTSIADASNVSCGLITISRSRLSTGTWTVTLAYSSITSEGVSTSSTVEVK